MLFLSFESWFQIRLEQCRPGCNTEEFGLHREGHWPVFARKFMKRICSALSVSISAFVKSTVRFGFLPWTVRVVFMELVWPTFPLWSSTPSKLLMLRTKLTNCDEMSFQMNMKSSGTFCDCSLNSLTSSFFLNSVFFYLCQSLHPVWKSLELFEGLFQVWIRILFYFEFLFDWVSFH